MSLFALDCETEVLNKLAARGYETIADVQKLWSANVNETTALEFLSISDITSIDWALRRFADMGATGAYAG
jgi:hypothetical protein